jgi:hypothetical protein
VTDRQTGTKQQPRLVAGCPAGESRAVTVTLPGATRPLPPTAPKGTDLGEPGGATRETLSVPLRAPAARRTNLPLQPNTRGEPCPFHEKGTTLGTPAPQHQPEKPVSVLAPAVRHP